MLLSASLLGKRANDRAGDWTGDRVGDGAGDTVGDEADDAVGNETGGRKCDGDRLWVVFGVDRCLGESAGVSRRFGDKTVEKERRGNSS